MSTRTVMPRAAAADTSHSVTAIGYVLAHLAANPQIFAGWFGG